MTDTSSQNIDSVENGETSPTSAPAGSDTETAVDPTDDIPRAVLESASRVYAFISDPQEYQCGADVLDAVSDLVSEVQRQCDGWAVRTGHEGLSAAAFAADAYQELLERIITSVALDARLASRRAQ